MPMLWTPCDAIVVMVCKMIKNYTELSRLNSFEERFRYLVLHGAVGQETFGFDRYFNQKFYTSYEWSLVRKAVISRDLGCDLGIPDHEILGKIIIHHMNPITLTDLESGSELLLNPEYLICVSHNTHNAIHYGDENLLPKPLVVRTPNDTCPWKQISDI